MSFLSEEQKKRIEGAEEKGDVAASLVEMKSALDKRDSEFRAALESLHQAVKGKAAAEDISAAVAKVEELGKKAQEMNAELLVLQQKMTRPVGGGNPEEQKSLGERFTELPEFKAFAAKEMKNLSMALEGFSRKDISSAAESAGGMVVPQYLPGIVGTPMQQLLIRDLIMPGVTSTNAIFYMREKSFSNNAAGVKELAKKPQSEWTAEAVTIPVRKIAHWMRASTEILDDVPMLASIIGERLIYGLKLEEERQILLGDGTDPNLFGIIPQATAYDTALETQVAIQDKNKMDMIRVAMLQVQLSMYPPSGIVLHPTDWASIAMTKDANGNYLIGNPQSVVSQILWGFSAIPSMSMAQGSFLVGAFRLGAQLFDRRQARIMVSREDGDNFKENAVTILAEERLALAVYRPAAFVTGTFTAAA